MDDRHCESADGIRSQIQGGVRDPARFRAALLDVPPGQRDAWVDRVLSLSEILPDDEPALPRGCVPYLPSPVDVLLRVVDHVPVRACDVFVDVGSGPGRAAAVVHLLTGAGAIGLEIQPRLVVAARELAARLLVPRVACVEGDAARLAGFIPVGTVFFLYCPFSGDRLARVLDDLESLADARPIRVCCVDLPLPPCRWLEPDPSRWRDLTIYRSNASADRHKST